MTAGRAAAADDGVAFDEVGLGMMGSVVAHARAENPAAPRKASGSRPECPESGVAGRGRLAGGRLALSSRPMPTETKPKPRKSVRAPGAHGRAARPDLHHRRRAGRVFVGDCREVVPHPRGGEQVGRSGLRRPALQLAGEVRRLARRAARDEYLRFTAKWLDVCVDALSDRGRDLGEHPRRHRRRDRDAPQGSRAAHDQLVRVALPLRAEPHGRSS